MGGAPALVCPGRTAHATPGVSPRSPLRRVVDQEAAMKTKTSIKAGGRRQPMADEQFEQQ